MKSSSAPITIPGPARGTRPAIAGGVLLLLVVAAGCGGRDSAASRSAAEFDRAQQQGDTAATTGGAHGGHAGGQEPADGGEAEDPAGMAGMDHSNMPGMQPSGGATTQGGGAMAGMDHSNMPSMKMAPPLPERPSVSAQPGQTAATLRPSDLDLPAPTSVRDAARSAAMAQEMAGGGHGGMTHGVYSQTDAGRDTITPSGGTTAPAHGGGHSPGAASPTTDPHQMHSAPAQPRPSPSPAAVSPPTTLPAQPSPAADPHRGHGQPAPPRPSPSPSAKENNE